MKTNLEGEGTYGFDSERKEYAIGTKPFSKLGLLLIEYIYSKPWLNCTLYLLRHIKELKCIIRKEI